MENYYNKPLPEYKFICNDIYYAFRDGISISMLYKEYNIPLEYSKKVYDDVNVINSLIATYKPKKDGFINKLIYWFKSSINTEYNILYDYIKSNIVTDISIDSVINSYMINRGINKVSQIYK